MRRYTLAWPEKRDKVDLIDYKDIIENAVHTVMPKAKVLVYEDCYSVDPTPSRSEAIRIGKKLNQTVLSWCRKPFGILFSSVEVVKGAENESKKPGRPKKSKYAGGHF